MSFPSIAKAQTGQLRASFAIDKNVNILPLPLGSSNIVVVFVGIVALTGLEF